MLAVILAAVSPAELAVRVLAWASRSAVLEVQAEMTFRPSTSYFLHLTKEATHFFSWVIAALLLSTRLHSLKSDALSFNVI